MVERVQTPSPDDLTGRLLGGRYRVERPLKRGGMGQVYAGRDEEGGGAVAVKVVRQALLEDPQALARFKREARLVTELKHENIVTSLAAGEDGGLLWIAMELLEGETLRERLDARGRMSWQDTLVIIEQVVRALQAAHDKGVIHRDLKPENVMLVRGADGERAKLLDFGVAKQAHVEGQSGTSNMTGTGLIVGTPGYVAPEVVLEGRTDDPRSDFYGLGVTWFEMLTAQKPFTAKTAFALAMRHAHEPAPTPTSFVPYSPVPGPVERLVLRLLAKNPDERPQNAVSLLDALKNLAEESQRALQNPTPPPSSLEPHQATMTATDLNKPSTGVVPFKTPMPLTAQTPSTAMQGLTPQPDYSQLLPELMSQVKRAVTPRRIAVASVVALVFIVCAGVGVYTMVQAAAARARTATDTGGARPPVASAVAIVPAPPAAPPAPAPPAPPAPPPQTAPQAPPETARHRARADWREARDARRAARKGDAASEVGSVHLNIGCPEASQSATLDGNDIGDLPVLNRELSFGKHVVVFVDAHGRQHSEEFIVGPTTTTIRCRVAKRAGK